MNTVGGANGTGGAVGGAMSGGEIEVGGQADYLLACVCCLTIAKSA